VEQVEGPGFFGAVLMSVDRERDAHQPERALGGFLAALQFARGSDPSCGRGAELRTGGIPGVAIHSS